MILTKQLVTVLIHKIWMCCNIYVQDEERFFVDYATAHKKMTMLGFRPRYFLPREPASRDGGLLMGVAVATTAMMIMGFLLSEISRKPVKLKRRSPPQQLGS